MSDLIPLKIFIRPERRFVAGERPTELVVLVRLVPAPLALVDEARLNLGIVLDCGGSMGGDRLEAAKEAMRGLVDELHPEDRLAVVTGGDFVDAVVPSTLVSDRRALKQQIQAITPSGLATLRPAWFGGAWEVSQHLDRARVNRVVIITDGMANTGTSSPDQVIELARGLFRRGISTSVLGIGDRFEEDVLVPLAVQGGGNAAYVEDVRTLGADLLAEARGARQLFSEWSTMRFDMQDAEVMDVLNEFPWVGERKVHLPPLYGDTPLNIVLRLRLRPGAAGQEINPLTIRVKTLDMEAKQAIVHRKRMKLHVVAPELADGMAPDLGVQAQAARLEFARMHQKCVRKIDQGDLLGARQLLDFSMGRFQSLSGQSGGTLLTEDLAGMATLRNRLELAEESARNRKFLRFSAVFAQRAGFYRPTSPS
ncbi:MAG: Ca-activated chloride channel family protein [Bradymonadia bacterium]